jgi:hypothetical protein
LHIDSSAYVKYNSGFGSLQNVYGLRMWINFNGQGTISIRGSGGVSSITDNNTGNYTVSLSFTMPDTNYAVTSSFQRVATTDEFTNIGFALGTTSFNLEFFAGGAQADSATISLIAAR